jgi:hypothetical protein
MIKKHASNYSQPHYRLFSLWNSQPDDDRSPGRGCRRRQSRFFGEVQELPWS